MMRPQWMCHVGALLAVFFLSTAVVTPLAECHIEGKATELSFAPENGAVFFRPLNVLIHEVLFSQLSSRMDQAGDPSADRLALQKGFALIQSHANITALPLTHEPAGPAGIHTPLAARPDFSPGSVRACQGFTSSFSGLSPPSGISLS